MTVRLWFFLMGSRLPRLVLSLFSLGLLTFVLISRCAPSTVAPSTDQFSGVTWTTTSVVFDYQAARDCPSLKFHYSFRDATNEELLAVDSLNGHQTSAGVSYHETLTLSPDTAVPAATTQIVITSNCS
jgi:hypothetical protein